MAEFTKKMLEVLYFLLNYFFLDRDVKQCARYHGDKHLNKMVVEYAQIVSAVWWINGPICEIVKESVYRLTHAHHPVVKWACEHPAHYHAIVELGLALIEEKKRRIAGMESLPKKLRKKWKPEHESGSVLVFCKQFTPRFSQRKKLPRDPPKCMPEAYWRDQDGNELDVITSYRLFYAKEKTKILKWEPYVEEPDFIKQLNY